MFSHILFKLSNPAKVLIAVACISFSTIVFIFKHIELKIEKAETHLQQEKMEIDQLESTSRIGNPTQNH